VTPPETTTVLYGHSWVKIAVTHAGFYAVNYSTLRNTDLFGNLGTVPAQFDSLRLFTLMFRNSVRAVDLFNEHLGKYPEDQNIHPKHRLETQAYKEIAKAEIKLFDTLTAWQLNGRKFDDQGEIKAGLMAADALYQAAYPVTLKWVDGMYPLVEGRPANPDRAEFERYANALLVRSGLA